MIHRMQQSQAVSALLITCLLSFTESFLFLERTPSATRSPSKLSSIIEPNDEEVQVDTGRGGVQLAIESVIQIKGSMKQEECELSDLLRFTQLTPLVDETAAASRVIFSGSGVEYYQDSKTITGTEAEVRYAPMEAVKSALNQGKINDTTAAMKHISINFAGGKDAQVLQVLDAAEEFTRILRNENIVAPSTKIDFRSISDDTFPENASCVTVVSVADSDEDATTVDSIAVGEIYRSQADGSYYTLLEKHINTAVE